MKSAEPTEPRFVNDPERTADETWRAEIASRVDRYRARQKNTGAEKDTSTLDFGSPAATPEFVAQNISAQNFLSQTLDVPKPVKPQGEEPRRALIPTTRNAFDTHYYRRLNSESLAQIPILTSVSMGATAAATAPARVLEAEFEEESEADVDALAEDAGDDSVLDLEIRPTADENAFLGRYYVSEPKPEPESDLLTDLPIMPDVTPDVAPDVPAAQGNLIVFRRPFELEPPLAPQPVRDELAEPMNNRPRILEVPEDIMPAVQGSLFPEIRLDMDDQENSGECEPNFAMPLRVASISARLMASLTDLAVVLVASGVFAGMAWRALPDMPHTKPFWMSLGVVSLLLWAVYQHMFLVYAGRTPGMSMRGIRLSTFDGQTPAWKQRVSRARFTFVSFASVALGFLWALVDEDELCWHDRISRTFPTTE